MQIIPFEQTAKLPAYLRVTPESNVNSDLLAHKGQGFPVLSIKGKQWAVVRDGERELLMNPKDPDSPASSIEVVLIKANKHLSKAWYAKAYDPSQGDDIKPACYSNDGISPAADSADIQSPKCATCRHNQWGSKVSTDGRATKGKSCQDAVRMAVAPGGLVKDAMLLRLPPASIKNLGEFGDMLNKRGVRYQGVITRLGFDPEAESPKITFKAVGLLDEQTFREVVEASESTVVQSILGIGAGAVPQVSPAGEEPPAPAEKPVAKAEKSKDVSDEEVRKAVKAADTKTVVKKAAPVVADTPDLEIELDGISFDD